MDWTRGRFAMRAILSVRVLSVAYPSVRHANRIEGQALR